jgi:hypothetical protein
VPFSTHCFLFLNFMTKNAMTISSIATTTTPLPIPAFAPVLSPELDEAALGSAAGDALAVGVEEAVIGVIEFED